MFPQHPNSPTIIPPPPYPKTYFHINHLHIFIPTIPLLITSSPLNYHKQQIQQIITPQQISIHLHLHQPNYEAQASASHLSYDYLKINALYTT
ncbi:bifunctional ornithine acetyltransferase/N-acetylglutamate synthase, partial [Staphylococcus epidermidis]|uniref:bifunctional ornithine acetyltransferase/N-acetylglutamate synthase n=1 Tax=Staphylococcus epidermidis TaxID=1282 RepID=UPI0037D9ED15